MILDLDAKEI